jgi:hypothetical protein
MEISGRHRLRGRSGALQSSADQEPDLSLENRTWSIPLESREASGKA